MTEQFGTRVDAPIVAGNNSDDDIASAINSQIQGAFQVFKTNADRDKWTNSYHSRLFKTTALVLYNDAGDQEPSWYRWDGANADGTDGKWSKINVVIMPSSGLTFVNDDGSSTSGIQVIALQGLELRGSNKDGFTLVAKGGAASFDIENTAKDSSYDVKGATGLRLGPNLEAYPDPNSGKAVLLIKPGMMAKATPPAMLAYLQDPVEIESKPDSATRIHQGAVWCDDILFEDDTFIPIDRNKKAFGLQEYDGLDPNITGGDRFFYGLIVSVAGNASSDGYVRAELMDVTTGAIAIDLNGLPVAMERIVKKGQPITPAHNPLILQCVLAAKGLEEYRLVVSGTFANDIIRLNDYTDGPTGFVVQSMSGDLRVSAALNQFIEDTGYDVRPEVRYMGEARASISMYTTMQTAQYEGQPGEWQSSATGFNLENKTEVVTSISGGCFIVDSGDSTDATDFMIKQQFTGRETRLLRGKTVSVKLSIKDKDNGWNVALFSWTGAPDKYTDVYSGRNNMDIVLNQGWKMVQKQFISEDVVAGLHDASFDFVVPKDATNYTIGIWPVQAQNPMSIQLAKLQVDVKNPFWAYTLNSPKIASDSRMSLLLVDAVLVQNTQGFASLRYTLNNLKEGNPLPLGIAQGKLPTALEFDPSVNVVVGSGANGGEGALKVKEVGEITLHFSAMAWNEQKTDDTLSLWIIKYDVDGNISTVGEVQTFTVPAGAVNREIVTEPITSPAAIGDRFALRGSSNIVDGAFLECADDSKPLIKTFVSFSGLVLDQN